MKTVQLWEIMKDGKNGDIFEVDQCSIPSYIGQQVKVQFKREGSQSFKSLVKADAKGDSEDTLFTIYGCLGTAKYRRVEQFDEVTFIQAMEKLDNHRMLYVKHGSNYVQFTKYTDFRGLGIDDISDLMNKTFYVKGGF